MQPPRRDWQEERGGRIDPMRVPEETPLSDDDRVDQAIAESFPASDPPSFNGGRDGDQTSDRDCGSGLRHHSPQLPT